MPESLYSRRLNGVTEESCGSINSQELKDTNYEPLAASYADRVKVDEEHEQTKWANSFFKRPSGV